MTEISQLAHEGLTEKNTGLLEVLLLDKPILRLTPQHRKLIRTTNIDEAIQLKNVFEIAGWKMDSQRLSKHPINYYFSIGYTLYREPNITGFYDVSSYCCTNEEAMGVQDYYDSQGLTQEQIHDINRWMAQWRQ